MIKKTYHYTSLENWNNIKVFGLKPYLIQKEEIERYFPGGIMGVWLWKNKPKGKSHTGCLLFQLSTKNSDKIAQLEIIVNDDDFLKYNNKDVELYHIGNIDKYLYHADEEARIHLYDIPPRNIKLLKIFDLVKLLK